MQHQHLQKLAGAANTEELRRAIEALCQPFGSPKDTGESHGWDSMWQRFMERAIKETKVENRFPSNVKAAGL